MNELEDVLIAAAKVVGTCGVLAAAFAFGRPEWKRARWLAAIVALFCGVGVAAIWFR